MKIKSRFDEYVEAREKHWKMVIQLGSVADKIRAGRGEIEEEQLKKWENEYKAIMKDIRIIKHSFAFTMVDEVISLEKLQSARNYFRNR